jgi:Na+/proline symporter
MPKVKMFSLFLTPLDWSFIIGFFVIAILIGFVTARKSKGSGEDYFLCGRNMPWWLLGFSMVATTFSTDTPNLVTNLVREKGVAANWLWWAALLTGMLTVFIFAKLWTRSHVSTDLEFYELRYSGKAATFLRGFRALYLGLFFNVMIMATCSLAAIKMGGILLGLSPWETLVYSMLITGFISTIGGLRGVIFTDLILFVLAMVGSFAAAYFCLQLPEIGGLTGLMEKFNTSATLAPKLDMFPSTDNWEVFVALIIIPLAIQWWSVWYPGAEPGGGGYLAQRMLAAKDESHSMKATFFFNFAHYALRPWPWIIVALCSMIIYPNLTDISQAFPHIPADKVGHDLAYPAMMTKLPAGWIGLVITSLIAAFMSTISTHLNWGSSYLVHDVYHRFYKPDASEKDLVWCGRFSTMALMVFTMIVALFLKDAMGAFQILLQIGAGTGLLFILRWFWWRISAISEITAMVVSLIVAIIFSGIDMPASQKLVIGVGITTLSWVIATFFSKPTDSKVLRHFVTQTNPGGLGWKKVFEDAAKAGNPIRPLHGPVEIIKGLLYVLMSCTAVYGLLFSVGFALYGQYQNLSLTIGISLVVLLFLFILLILRTKTVSKKLDPIVN